MRKCQLHFDVHHKIVKNYELQRHETTIERIRLARKLL